MLTASEKKCLALTLAFMAMGAGARYWNARAATVGPTPLASVEQVVTAPAPSGSFTDDTVAAASAVPEDTLEPERAEVASAPATAGFSSMSDAGRNGKRREERPKPKSRTGNVSLNHAGAAALSGVPGIGPKTADAILAYRKVHGDFRDVGELLNVKGIGEKKLEKLRGFLVISPVEAEEPVRQASLLQSVHQ